MGKIRDQSFAHSYLWRTIRDSGTSSLPTGSGFISSMFVARAGEHDSMTDRSSHPAGRRDGGMKSSRKILLGIIAGLLIVFAIVAVLTFTMTVTTDTSGVSLPFETHYSVSFPDGNAVMIGSSRIAVMAYNGSVITDVDGNREQLATGQTRLISPRHATISIFGIPIYNADFQITLQYLGSTGTKDNFDLTVATSQKIPSFLLDRLVPSSVMATQA